MKVLLQVFSVLVLLVAFSQDSSACSTGRMIPFTPQREFESATAVFEAEFQYVRNSTQNNERDGAPSGDIEVVFKVVKPYKGMWEQMVGRELVIHWSWVCVSSFGSMHNLKGDRWLIYASIFASPDTKNEPWLFTNDLFQNSLVKDVDKKNLEFLKKQKLGKKFW